MFVSAIKCITFSGCFHVELSNNTEKNLTVLLDLQ